MHLIWNLLLTILFCWFLNFIFIRPYLKLLSYKKKGAVTYYFPILGLFFRNNKDATKHNDFYYFSKNLVKTRPDMKLYATNFGSNVVLHIVDPILAKDVLQNYQRYKKGKFIEIPKMLVSRSIVSLEGEDWKARRRITAKAFHFEYLKNLIPSIQRLTNETFAEWKAAGPGKEINSLDKFQRLVGGIFAVTFLGSDRENHRIEGQPVELYFSELLTDLLKAIITPLAILFGAKAVKYGITPFYRRIIRRNQVFREFVGKIVRERKKRFEARIPLQESDEQKDLLDIMLEFQDNQQPFSDDELIDEFGAFFSGGTDTSSHLLQSLFYYLDEYPEYKKLFIEEVNSIIKDPKQEITMEQVNRLEFTSAIIKEALRMIPPVPVLVHREAVIDHYIGDFFVPKGVNVLVDFVAINHNPKIYENPEKFNPYRWIKGHPDYNEEANRDPFKFLPFSAGPRNCLGQPLAMLEMKVILALFASQFDWKVKEGYKQKLIFKFGYEQEEQVPLILQPKTTERTAII